MDAPLLLALARAHLRARAGWALDSAWASPRALGLRWGRRNDAELWLLLLQPRPEFWRLPADHPAAKELASEALKDSPRAWGAWLSGARLLAAEGDPRERRLDLRFQRRAITGRLETVRIAFQAIPGRAGIRLDGVDVQVPRLGLGSPFPAEAAIPDEDPPPLRRWRDRFGEDLDAALAGELPEVMEGEGDLFARHRAWSGARAEALVLLPRRQAAERALKKEEARLERLAAALEQDRTRHDGGAELRAKASDISAELYRLKGAEGSVELLDGRRLELPRGESAERAAQLWFAAAKKAERGLARVAELAAELERARRELAQRRAAFERGELEAPALKAKARESKPEKKKVKDEAHKRKDGKGAAFRSVNVEGFEVLIGKGDAENDQLTFKVADNPDFWLHVANVPGSHVVIRNPDKLSELPKVVVERAAQLAAFHSKARDGGKVEVHLARIADISKPKGFAPGKVILKKWTSVRVYPKE